MRHDLIAQRLRERRKALKLSRQGLEDATGVHRNTILRAERDPSGISLFKLECICQGLHVNLAHLLDEQFTIAP